MAGQKKEASPSILRRALDQTPLRPASLETSRPQALNPASFAARYFGREGGIIQRLLGIGGESSPIHQAIGRSIVNRFTDFNRSFGPIQRALRPQPEHQPRRRPQLEAEQDYDSYEPEDSGYYPEPAFFEQPATQASQYSQNENAYREPAAAPWVSPLNSTPLPVARRTEFQPANLRYLTNPEQAVERQIIQPSNRLSTQIPAPDTFRATEAAQFVERPISPLVESQVARTQRPVVSTDLFPEVSPVERGKQANHEQPAASALPQPAESTLAQPDATVNSPSFFEAQPAIESSQVNNYATQAVPPAQPSPTATGPIGRISENSGAASGLTRGASDYREATFTPVYQPQPQPALSRALQRTFDPAAPQTGVFNTTINQGSNLGASPSAIARHFAAPATIARYRAVKQIADKVFLGEQPAQEAEQTPAFEPQPLAPIYNPPPVQRATQETTLASEAAAQKAIARDTAAQKAPDDLQEARRVREEPRALLETSQSATPASNGEAPQVQRPEAQSLPGQPSNLDLDAAQPSRNVGFPAQAETTQTGRVQRTPGASQPPETAPTPDAARVNGRNRISASGQAVNLSEAPVQRNIQPGSAQSVRSSGINAPENSPTLFDMAIPASLLESNFAPGENTSEVRRLTGNRPASPIMPGSWANNLASLRNNPGVEARTNVARQLSEPAVEGAIAADAWGNTGAGVYYDQRRVQRTRLNSEAVEAAAETQDRIFSLTETPTGLSNFQPQLMQGLTAEMAVPVAPTVNRNSLAPREFVQSPAQVNRTAAEPVAPANNELTSPTAAAVNRALDAAAPEAAATPERALTPPVQGQPENITAVSRSNPIGETVRVETVETTGRISSPEGAVQPSSNPGRYTEAAIQAENYIETAGEGVQPARVQRISNVNGLQPTALQRVFKRLDLDEPGSATFAENSAFDFANLPMSYAARPGSRTPRASQQDNQAYYEEAGLTGYSETAYPQSNFAGQLAPEAAIESPTRPAEPSVARTQAATEAVVKAPEAAGEPEARFVSPEPESDTDSTARNNEFTNRPGQQVTSQDVLGIQRAVSPVSGEAPRSNQSQYFANSLESAWLSPENRLLVERLPGGSSALQRLMQAPGQLQSFLAQQESASVGNLSLPSLRNNPGLSTSVARALEERNTSGSAGLDGWSDSPTLNFVQRHRVGRQAQDSFGDFDNGGVQLETFSFEQPLPNPNDLPVQFKQTQPEMGRSTNQASQPEPIQRATTAQPGNFQGNANRETAARLQRATPTEPGQSAPTAGSFTISSDWVAQLQRRFDGFAVGQLSASAGQVMRFLNNDAASFGGFGGGPISGPTGDFNYAVPPLLWRKVSDYSPRGGLPTNPDLIGRDQPGISYTSPGEILRAYEQGETYSGWPDDAAYPAEPGATAATRQDGSARLDLPRLQQTHQLLQRINNLEKLNTSLELSSRMEAAAKGKNNTFNPVQPGVTPLSMPFAVQRQPETTARPGNRVDRQSDNLLTSTFESQLENRPASLVERFPGNGFDTSVDAAEAAPGSTPPAPLRMTDVPVNRPGADNRSLTSDSDFYTDDGYAHPAPEIRTIEIHVPDRHYYGTPLETAAARNGSNGPNMGQGEILQPLAIQRKASVNGPSQTTYAPLAQPALHNIIKTSVGRTLDHPIQRKMTNIFGNHFQDVRVHTGDEAAQATRHVGAEAFTLGSDIYFAPGRYQPENQAGQALIGHELTHVIQQSSLPSLGNGRVPETSSLGQSLEHHAIANEHLLLRHLSNNQDDHDHHHGFSSDDGGRLSFQDNHASPSYGGTATVERSYQPVSQQNNNPPIKPAHIRSGSSAGFEVQRALDVDQSSSSSTDSSVNVDDIIKDQEGMDKLARKVYQIMRDELMIERERGFGPGNGKFF